MKRDQYCLLGLSGKLSIERSIRVIVSAQLNIAIIILLMRFKLRSHGVPYLLNTPQSIAKKSVTLSTDSKKKPHPPPLSTPHTLSPSAFETEPQGILLLRPFLFFILK